MNALTKTNFHFDGQTMKKSIILFFGLICICGVFGQDTLNLKVEYFDRVPSKDYHYVINMVYFGSNTNLTWLDQNDIESIEILKDVSSSAIRTSSAGNRPPIIIVRLKDEDYKPQPITLKDLKNKYTKLKNEPAIFLIDSNLITEENFLIDENYILKMIIEKIKNPKDNSDLWVVKLVTKTEKIENREKRKSKINKK